VLKELLTQANKKPPSSAIKTARNLRSPLSRNRGFGAEGYSLVVTSTGVASPPRLSTGQFYAIQTLRQLFPPEVELKTPAQVPQPSPWTPCPLRTGRAFHGAPV